MLLLIRGAVYEHDIKWFGFQSALELITVHFETSRFASVEHQ